MTVIKEYSPIKTFKDLDVFQRAYQLSLSIHQASLQFPKIEQFALGDQLRAWIRYCFDLRYISKITWENWREEYIRISKMLQSLINKSR